ncbi:tRNA (adenosine(37)-N6)-threonylcarbamoyltransferase complex transferase subunit TsaD [Patescibacteria group bacterium]|nr:tRNA (adenosine(37)-N6)-threonylcarbamoyltransferase complex transferase subunit TsaD [Patescibacteria group bacterium]
MKKILAIETSCDDTCAAVLDGDRILSDVISSQIDLHAKWGGVVPNLAKRAHEEKIGPIVEEALKRARVKIEEIDLIGITYGPGLAVALGVGIEKAKDLAKKYKKKLVAVNHIEGHILSNFLKNSRGKPERKIELPALVLTVSGGHSKIVLMKKIGKYEVKGETLDDAAGEALDKASKLMGLGYPGGAIIERLAEKGDEKFLDLPRPMKGRKGFDYSFSGLKTSFYYQIKDWSKEKIGKNFANLAASFQEAVFDSLLIRFEKAVDYYCPKSLMASGGVMANQNLRKRLKKLAKKRNLPLYLPWSKKLNTDNAAMIGVVAYYKAKRGEFVKNISKLDREPRAKL